MARLLLLEDDFVLSQDYRSALQALGHDVIVCDTATPALYRWRNVPIDLTIVDIIVLDSGVYIKDGGMDSILKVRKHERAGPGTKKPLPIVAVSGSAAARITPNGLLQGAMAVGANHAFAKPGKLKAFVGQVERLIEKLV